MCKYVFFFLSYNFLVYPLPPCCLSRHSLFLFHIPCVHFHPLFPSCHLDLFFLSLLSNFRKNFLKCKNSKNTNFLKGNLLGQLWWIQREALSLWLMILRVVVREAVCGSALFSCSNSKTSRLISVTISQWLASTGVILEVLPLPTYPIYTKYIIS